MSEEAAPIHEGHVVIGDIRTLDAPKDVGLLTLRFVHYPGAQQLILWLPQSGYHGYGDLTVTYNGAVIEHATVRNRLNGSVQILWNTLAWAPGDYVIGISHEAGWRHEAELRKLEEGVSPPTPEPPPEPMTDEPKVYRDGFGREIPNLDLEMRAQIHKDIARKFARRLEYAGTFRGGSVIYSDGVYRIAFDNEMCGGDMKFTIYLPTAEHWESATGAPLAERDDIVGFVARQVQKEQASSWRYEITADSIDFY